MNTRILIIGAGGIGALLASHVSRAYAFSNPVDPLTLTIRDGDSVEERNLPHQPFTADDVGTPKVEALVRQLRETGITEDRRVALIAAAEDLRQIQTCLSMTLWWLQWIAKNPAILSIPMPSNGWTYVRVEMVL